jgi:mono/diheme cytochrome c family protein
MAIMGPVLATQACGAQQGASGPQPADTSVLASGVYTSEQATFGEQGFQVVCSTCHGDFDLLAPSFLPRWTGRSLEDLYLRIKNTMPENDPGTLTPEQTVQLISYILSVQGVPAGDEPLPAVESVLREIPIDTVGVARPDSG